MIISIWVLLLIIGVSDAREYRIPNYLILLLLAIGILFTVLGSPDDQYLSALAPRLLGLFVGFIIGLVFYVKKIMAAGDVKLLAVMVFFVGYGELIEFVKYVSFACCFIGVMYLLNNRLVIKRELSTHDIEEPKIHMLSGSFLRQLYKFKCSLTSNQELTYMPLAPVLIIGLAMYQYFQY